MYTGAVMPPRHRRSWRRRGSSRAEQPVGVRHREREAARRQAAAPAALEAWVAAVPRGIHSSLRDWAVEEANHPRAAIGAALAEVVLNSARDVGQMHLAISLTITAAEAERKIYFGTLIDLGDSWEAKAAPAGLRLLADPEPIQIVSPFLHHSPAFGQERRPVVGPAVGIPYRVCQLVLDEVGPGRSGPAFWVATPRSALRCPCPRRAWRGRRRESAGHHPHRLWVPYPRARVLPGARCPEGRLRGQPETRAAIARSSCRSRWKPSAPGSSASIRATRPPRCSAPDSNAHRGLWKALREGGRSIDVVAVVRTRGNLERARTILVHWATASTASGPSRHGARDGSLEAAFERGAARAGADRRAHMRHRGACAPKRHFDVRASASLCGWLSYSCGTAAGTATPLRSSRP